MKKQEVKQILQESFDRKLARYSKNTEFHKTLDHMKKLVLDYIELIDEVKQ